MNYILANEDRTPKWITDMVRLDRTRQPRRMPIQKPGRSKQNYATPDDFMAATLRRLDIKFFSFDFAADSRNAKSFQFWTKRDNALALSRDWSGKLWEHQWGWLNPPFDHIDPWAARCVSLKASGRQIAFLVPASVGANWYRDHVHDRARVLFLNGRLAFIKGKPRELYPKDCILALYSHAIDPGYEVWTWRKE